MVHSPKDLFGNINFIFKIVEVILLIVACIFIANRNTAFYDQESRDLTVVAAAGYLIITFTLLVLYIFDDTNVLYELLVLFVGFVILIVAAILAIICYSDDTNHRGNTLLVAVLTLAAGVVMCVDWIFNIKKK